MIYVIYVELAMMYLSDDAQVFSFSNSMYVNIFA